MRRFNILFFVGNLALLVIIGSHVFPTAHAQNSTVEDNIARAEQFVNNVWNREDPGYVSDYFTPRVTWHPPDDGPDQGAYDQAQADLTNYLRVLARAFPDFQVTIDNIIATEEFVVIQYTFSGPYELNLPPSYTPFPPSGELAVWDGVFIQRIEDGLVAESWWYWDNFTLVSQPLRDKLSAVEAAE